MPRDRTFLIISLRYIGDILLSTALARSIKAALPDATVDYLVFAGNEGILDGNPDVRRVLTMRPGGSGTSRSTDKAVILFPQPLSPTSASVFPFGMASDTPSTARASPPSV